MFEGQIKDVVMAMIAEKANIPVDQLKLNNSLINDLGMDSFTLVEVAYEIRELYGIKLNSSELSQVKTISDTIEIIKNNTFQKKGGV